MPYTISTFRAKLDAADAEDTDLLAFNSSALTFVLINAVKELSTRIEESEKMITEREVLKQENETQLQRIAELEVRLAAIEQRLKNLKP